MSRRPRFVYAVTDPLSFRLGTGHVALMQSAGFDVHAVSSPGPLADEFSRNESVPVHPVRMARRISPLRDILALVQWIVTLRRLRPEVVHAGTPKAGVLGTLAAWLLRVPVRIYYVHGLPFLTARGVRRLMLLAVEKLTCAAATHVVCVGPSMHRQLVAQGVCAEAKATVLGNGSSNGVDLRVFDPRRFDAAGRAEVRRRVGIPVDALVVGFIGRVGHEKGIEQLLGAWRAVRSSAPRAYLLLVGPDEPNDPVSPACLDQLRNDPRVRLTGANWDTPPLYAAMDVFCLPSHREGLPNVLLEAAAMELPVVAFAVPGVVDAVADRVTALLVEPLSINGLAAALRKYLDDSQLRRIHGTAGRAWVVHRFEREKVWNAFTKFYSSVNFRSLSAGADSKKTSTERASASMYRRWGKRGVDIVIAAVALIAAAPALLLVGLAVRLRLGSPVFFVHTRPGRHGRLFNMVKFRTMSNARDQHGRLLPDAQRLSGFGRVLRTTSVDELPELWNVLVGDMSLVGPRPLLTEYLPLYSREETRRHDVRPGITGLAQVNGRNALTFPEKFAFDLEYVERCSFALDVSIVLRTVGQVCARRGVSQTGHATAEKFAGSAAQ